MTKLILVAVGCAVLALAIFFLVVLIKFRNKAVDYQERIKNAKSRVRVEANSYTKQMKNSVNVQKQTGAMGSGGMGNGGGFLYGNMANAQMYGMGTSLVQDLGSSYEKAQYALNELISEYNRFIGKFPNLILAAILRYKKEEYIDESHLEASTKISGVNENLI